jgi:hypothetical protein
MAVAAGTIFCGWLDKVGSFSSEAIMGSQTSPLLGTY